MIEAIQSLFVNEPALAQAGRRVTPAGESASAAFQAELDAYAQRGAGATGSKRDDAVKPEPVDAEARDGVSARDAGSETKAETPRAADSTDGADRADAKAEDAERADAAVVQEAAAQPVKVEPEQGAIVDEPGENVDAAEGDASVADSVDASVVAGAVAAAVGEDTKRKEAAAEQKPAGQDTSGARDIKQSAAKTPELSAARVADPAKNNAVTLTNAQAAPTEQPAGESQPLAVQAVTQSQTKAKAAAAQPVAATTATAAPISGELATTSATTQSNPIDPAAARTQAAPAREADPSALNSARLTRGLASAVNQRGGAVTLRLTPPDMGTVRIQMQLTGAVLSASMHTETASAHQLLTQQLGQLRTSLESQGLTVERLHVQPMQQAQPGSAADQNGDNESRHQHNEGRSRGRQDGGNNPRGDARDSHDARDGRPEPQTFNDHLDNTPADAAA